MFSICLEHTNTCARPKQWLLATVRSWTVHKAPQYIATDRLKVRSLVRFMHTTQLMSHSAERWEWRMEHHFPFAPRRKSVMRMPCWQRCCHGLGRVRVWWRREGGMERWVTDGGTSRQEAGTMDASLHSYVKWGHKLQVNKTHNAGKKRRFLALLGRKRWLNNVQLEANPVRIFI